VREAEEKWQSADKRVPAVLVNDRYLITGAQPPEAFEQAIRRAVSEVA
jgi:predicted DsbA family dithiol-disulfide isomerase